MTTHYSPLDNITNIKLKWQLKSRTGRRGPGTSTTVASLCSCRKHGKMTCPDDNLFLTRGDQVYVLRRRVNKIEDQTWYKTERWRPACFHAYIERVTKEELIAYPFEQAIKKPSRATLADEMGEETYHDYVNLQAKLRMYKGRLKKYEAKLNPTTRTATAISKAQMKIQHITLQLEGYTKWLKPQSPEESNQETITKPPLTTLPESLQTEPPTWEEAQELRK